MVNGDVVAMVMIGGQVELPDLIGAELCHALTVYLLYQSLPHDKKV